MCLKHCFQSTASQFLSYKDNCTFSCKNLQCFFSITGYSAKMQIYFRTKALLLTRFTSLLSSLPYPSKKGNNKNRKRNVQNLHQHKARWHKLQIANESDDCDFFYYCTATTSSLVFVCSSINSSRKLQHTKNKIPVSSSFVLPILQLQEEGNWHRATFYNSLGTEPLNLHEQALWCSELPPMKQHSQLCLVLLTSRDPPWMCWGEILHAWSLWVYFPFPFKH